MLTSGAPPQLSTTKMRFVLHLNLSYEALVASGKKDAFTSDLREAMALAFQVCV